MKKDSFNKLINNLGLSLFASFLFAHFLEPIVQICKNWSSGIIDAFVDYFFYSCAHINASIFMCYFAYYVLSGFIIYLILRLFPIISTIDGEEKTDQNNINSELNGQKLIERPENLELKVAELKKQEKRVKKKLKIATIITIVF